jgi:hypothetical protein
MNGNISSILGDTIAEALRKLLREANGGLESKPTIEPL